LFVSVEVILQTNSNSTVTQINFKHSKLNKMQMPVVMVLMLDRHYGLWKYWIWQRKKVNCL